MKLNDTGRLDNLCRLAAALPVSGASLLTFALRLMCFVLYIATARPLPIVPWDERARGIHTEPLSDRDSGVATQFLHPHVCYIGSDTHCGCGFRNASYQSGSWPEEEWRPEDDTSHLAAQPNHERLVEFLKRHFPDEPSIELYGMWEADFSDPALSDQRIPLERLLSLSFYFRDRGHYIVDLTKGEPGGSTIGSQPIGSEKNPTSSAAGSRR